MARVDRLAQRAEPTRPLNACELEIDLQCRGLRISGTSPAEARNISRTRAGLGSGLELILPTGSRIKPEIWVNVPVVEPFTAESPYWLARDNEMHWRIVDDRTYEAVTTSAANPTGQRVVRFTRID